MQDLWKYCTKQHCNEFLLSLRLFGDTEWPAKKQIATLYALSNHIERHYRRLSIPKKDGKLRLILAPDRLLSLVQRNLLHHVLEAVPLSPYATAYRKNTSIVANAAPHVQKKVVLKLDIEDFFGSITFSMVCGHAFPATLYPPAVQTLLANLCCHLDVLPQGAPTSPAISNLVMRPFDAYIGKWCWQRNIAYTRYCDDMAFSGDFEALYVKNKASGFLAAMGFTINENKTRLLYGNQRQAVTGIVVNEKLQVSAQYRRRLRQELYYCERFGVCSHLARTRGVESSQQDVEKYLQTLLGKVQHVLQVNPQDRFFLDFKHVVIGWMRAL